MSNPKSFPKEPEPKVNVEGVIVHTVFNDVSHELPVPLFVICTEPVVVFVRQRLVFVQILDACTEKLGLGDVET